MQRNAGLFSQHVSSIIMPIFRSTLVSTAFWCPNLENMSSEVWSTSVVCMFYTRILPPHTPAMSHLTKLYLLHKKRLI
jgi:hypothetical protein